MCEEKKTDDRAQMAENLAQVAKNIEEQLLRFGEAARAAVES